MRAGDLSALPRSNLFRREPETHDKKSKWKTRGENVQI